MTLVHTYFYIVAETQRGCRTLKLKKKIKKCVKLVIDTNCTEMHGQQNIKFRKETLPTIDAKT